MDFALHLPLMEFRGEGVSRARLESAVDASREAGFAAVPVMQPLPDGAA